jgi:hypothetical protein
VQRVFDGLDVESKGVDDDVDERDHQNNHIVEGASGDGELFEVIVGNLEPFAQNA